MKRQLFELRYVVTGLIAVTLLIGLLIHMGNHSKSELKGKDMEFFGSEMELDVPALVSLTDTILVGNVSNITIGLDYSYINISVSEYVKGPVPNTSIIIKMFQGIAAPSFTIGERVIVFLIMENDYFELASWGQGKFTIEVDPVTGREILKETGEYLDDFASQIGDIMATKLEDRTRK